MDILHDKREPINLRMKKLVIEEEFERKVRPFFVFGFWEEYSIENTLTWFPPDDKNSVHLKKNENPPRMIGDLRQLLRIKLLEVIVLFLHRGEHIL